MEWCASNTAARLWTEGEHAAVCHQISFPSTRQEIENRHVGIVHKLEDTAYLMLIFVWYTSTTGQAVRSVTARVCMMCCDATLADLRRVLSGAIAEIFVQSYPRTATGTRLSDLLYSSCNMPKHLPLPH